MSLEEHDILLDPEQLGLLPEPAVELALRGDDATRALGRALASVLRPGEVLGLLGQLGAGKTTLVQGVSAALGVDAATSPTYTLVNLYERGDVRLAHIDLYRLETFDDLESIGYWEVVEDADTISCVEWLNQLPEAWPDWGKVEARCGFVLWLMRADEGASRVARVWASASDQARVARLPELIAAEQGA